MAITYYGWVGIRASIIQEKYNTFFFKPHQLIFNITETDLNVIKFASGLIGGATIPLPRVKMSVAQWFFV